MSLVDTTAWRAPDEHAQPHVVALGALGFLDRALAHLDRKRDRAHGDRVGRVGAGAARGRDQPFGKFGQRGLIEEGGHRKGLTRFGVVRMPKGDHRQRNSGKVREDTRQRLVKHELRSNAPDTAG